MDFKYLNDGRKVVVIGQLNNQETIVQEVFVNNNGDELPSGERFVVKSLHQEPVKSWQEKEQEKLKQRCKEYQIELNRLNKEIKKANADLKNYKDRLLNSSKLVEKLPQSDLSVFTAFLTGNIEYLIFESYVLSAPVKFHEATVSRDDWDNKLKLLSVFGNSNGELTYNVNRYSDGSGGWTQCIPCETYEKALEVLKNLATEKANNGRLSKDEFDLCNKLGIQLPPESLQKYQQDRSKSIEKNISHATEELEKTQTRIKKYQEELEGLST